MWIRCWSRDSARGTWWSRQPQTPPLSARGGVDRACGGDRPAPAPYSSDYDPNEELWSKFKGQLRRIARGQTLYKAVGETLDSVTIQDTLGWFNHSGLYATHG